MDRQKIKAEAKRIIKGNNDLAYSVEVEVFENGVL